MTEPMISLKKLVELIIIQSNESRFVFDKNRYEFVNDFIEEYISEFDSIDNFKLLNKKVAQQNSNLVPIPSRTDIQEDDFMEKFCKKIGNNDFRKSCCSAKGKVIFKQFNQAIESFGLINEWNKFRTEQISIIALNWCHNHGLNCFDDTGNGK